ncbi:hypothetical protein [Anaerosporomusa subterranea]|nr:hypothetical protein [Anaerosporomusa subterranea]
MFYLIFNWNGQLLVPTDIQMDNLFFTGTVNRPIPLNANCV